MVNNWSKRLRELAKHTNVLFINILGISGSGKTNVACYLWELLRDHYKHGRLIRLESVDDYKDIEIAPNTYLVLEDFTYLASRHTTQVDSFLRDIMLVRHKLKKACIVIISHYYTSVLPILRMSHVRILTSLTTPNEIKQLKTMFDLSSLWDYYNIYINKYYEYWVLINLLGANYIMKPPLTKTYIKIQNKTDKYVILEKKQKLTQFSETPKIHVVSRRSSGRQSPVDTNF